MASWSTWLNPNTRSRRLLIALAVYVACVSVYAAVGGPAKLGQHTSFNHYALLADAWLHGRQDLAHGPPGYTGNNDFAVYNGKTYISFPPFPAVLMVPLVALAGTPEEFRDGQFVIWLAGIGPALLFFVLEKLRRTERSTRSERENAALALLFAFGTVYFFTAVEGTVWFAAHVVGVGLITAYVLCALDAEHPVLAGALLGCAFATRVSPILAAPLFALEAIRVSCKEGLASQGTLVERARATWERVDRVALGRRYVAFALPILIVFALCSWSNYTRFGNLSPNGFGHEYLAVAWHGRIEKWGIAGYHYLAKNLGCMLTILPWLPPHGTPVSLLAPAPGAPSLAPPFQINEHGLALWFTTPIYLWLLWPRARGWLHDIVALSVVGPLFMDLLYQNSGWRQFGYRFSNDYAPLLFVLLALGQRRISAPFGAAAAWGVAINLFGAITFDRGDPKLDRYYFRESSQAVLYQPD
jgi:hypothetical protein